MRLTRKKVKLGDRIRDRITGFEGVAVSRTEWMNGCVRFAIQPTELKDGKPIGAEWFDEGQVELVVPEKKKAAKKERGGPMPDPRPQRGPSF